METRLLITLVMEGRVRAATVDTLSRGIWYLTDGRGEGRSHAVAQVFCDEGACILRSVGGAQLQDEEGNGIEEATLMPLGREAAFSLSGGRARNGASLFVRPAAEGTRSFHKLGIKRDCTLVVGRDDDCAISYASRWVSAHHAELSFEGDAASVRDLGSSNGTFLNGRALAPGATEWLAPGDVVQVMDLTILLGRRFVAMNRPPHLDFALGDVWLPISHANFVERAPEATPDDELPERKPFRPAPRLMRTVHRRTFNVEEPPKAKEPDDTPAIVKMGPSFLMGLSSIFMAANAVSRFVEGASILSTAPSITICVAMLGGMLVWPQIARRYERKRAARDEERRRSAYSDYIAATEARFRDERDEQASILAENRITAVECLRRARELDSRLMGRSPLEPDFMQLRIGTGELLLDADFRWPERRFTMDRDDLLDMARGLSGRPPTLEDAPVVLDLLSSWVTGVSGRSCLRWDLVRSLVAQVSTFHGVADVKVAAVVPQGEAAEWSFLMGLPHTLADDGRTRLVASDERSMRELSGYLARVMAPRLEGQGKRMLSDYGPYHLVLCADRALADSSDVIARLESLQENRGLSLLLLGDGVDDLPRECSAVVELAAPPEESVLYNRSDVAGTRQGFVLDGPVAPPSMEELSLVLSRLDVAGGDETFELPASIGFLETYKAGSVADLDVEGRWSRADSSRSLAAPVGIDSRGSVAMIDPHESFDGPHGLVAGTTGSGKSELLISWILSTAVCFPPEQAAFVLIDYKGGGLADAFDREGLRLPHLAGTVTNLDGAEVSRSLTSLQAELVRRQTLLAEAKRATGDATMDVSAYQRHYAAGELSEPMPHLFVVADEFAELKQQEPEFMDGLVSAARIGRSLGVHLVLATQKPTGVVSDQIQANSRFRVCLRVADASDSKEMIRRSDAAVLEGPGRFILLVGYDERYALGQAAWAGAPYVPREEAEPARDLAVELCDTSGRTVDSLRPPSGGRGEGTELDAVLGEVRRAAAGRKARRLWLPPLERRPTVDGLEARYPGARADDEPWELDPIVGELDDPARQEKRLLTMPLSRVGNVAIYGHATSGREDLALSLVWNMLDVSPDDACAYVVDAGTGVLLAFGGAPQVPDAIPISDVERVSNLFKYLGKVMSDRRTVLGQGYSGLADYNARHCGPERMYSIAVVLNGVAELLELVTNIEERLVSLMREGPRYGIHFVLLSDTQRDVRFRMRASVGQSLVMALADDSDYLAMFGSMRGMALPKGQGRGLVRQGDDLYVFQCAYVANEGAPIQEIISVRVAEEVARRGATTRRVPTLPTILTPALLPQGEYGKGLTVGITGDDFMPIVLGEGRERANLVCAAQTFQCVPFMQACALAAHERGWDVVIVDPTGILGAAPWWTVYGPAGAALGSCEGDGKRRLVLVPNARETFKGSDAALLTSIVCDGGHEGTLLLATASASDLTAIQSCQWGQRLMFRNGIIWIGPGLANAYAFQVVTPPSQLKENMGEGGGYYIHDARARPSKFVSVPDEDGWGS